ncbi:Uncharacterised protein [Mycobacteroides abscessus subsp. bolletii]|nr:Uncharacterised protein [Mycobacteroides abscessus subsp. bolletii]SKH96433.1 Uncharacterised protein [Mycobacteroides abscessus subsp. bolletii]
MPVLEDDPPAAEEFSVVLRPDLPWSAPDFWVSGFSVFGPVVLELELVVLGCFVEVFPVPEDVVPLAEEFSVVVRPDLPWSAADFWVSGFSVFGLVVFVFGLVVLVLSWVVVVLVVLCGCSAFLVVGLLGCSVPAEVSGAVVPAALEAASAALLAVGVFTCVFSCVVVAR